MGFAGRGASALVACAMLAGCVAQTPAPETTSVAPVAFTPPPVNWQWTDAPAGPTVTLHTTDVTPAASSGSRTASLGLVCSNSVPAILVAWDAPVADQAGLSYRFDGGPERDLAAQSADPQSELVSDPLVVSRFIDEAAASHRLVVRAGSTQATFATADDSGNLTRFRTTCPDGTN
jgi:hypothetical protein